MATIDITTAPSWEACQAAKDAWQAELANNGRSTAARKLCDDYYKLIKACTREVGVRVD